MATGKVDALLGIVFGDEGKGKVVDFFTPHYDVVARFAGGPNAGHTIIFDGKKFVLRSIPSGIFDEQKVNIIGNGCVIAPDLFMAEAHELEAAGYALTERLHISRRAHLILPTHRVLDRAYEAAKGKSKVGTTGKGIGPTYSDKAARIGLRVGDIQNNFEEKYEALKNRHLQILKDLNYTDFDITEEEKKWLEGVDYMRKFHLTDTEIEINRYLSEGKKVLAEGAQGSMLDIDHGTYPLSLLQAPRAAAYAPALVWLPTNSTTSSVSSRLTAHASAAVRSPLNSSTKRATPSATSVMNMVLSRDATAAAAGSTS